MKKPITKLPLKAETIKTLTPERLAHIAGGLRGPDTDKPTPNCWTLSYVDTCA
jgi:hypothetical protein